MHGLSAEPAVVELLDSLVGVLLAAELDVHVADQVVAQVVTHVHLLDLSELKRTRGATVSERTSVVRRDGEEQREARLMKICG